MGGIFISYRREDSAGHAGRICDHLNAIFGADSVFLDVDDIQPGQTFPEVIRARIADASATVVVIGRRWLEILRSRGSGESDYVATEIRTALDSGKVVIPVLVGGAAMPAASDLPQSLLEFVQREALEIHDTSFAADAAKLAEALKKVAGLKKPDPAQELTGTWIAVMEKQGRQFRMRLNLEVFGEGLYGTVEYPTGEGAIQDAKLNGARFSFHTTHVPQFESRPAKIQTEGELAGEQIRLISVDNFGVARGTATRQIETGKSQTGGG